MILRGIDFWISLHFLLKLDLTVFVNIEKFQLSYLTSELGIPKHELSWNLLETIKKRGFHAYQEIHFDWNEECQNAFQALKQELCSNCFLTYFNHKLPLVVACDASPVGLGAVLAHKLPSGEEKPISYATRTLSNSERNYSQIDKKSLAIIFGVKHFHFFLYGKIVSLFSQTINLWFHYLVHMLNCQP